MLAIQNWMQKGRLGNHFCSKIIMVLSFFLSKEKRLWCYHANKRNYSSAINACYSELGAKQGV